MEPKDWVCALQLSLQYPLLIIAAFSIASATFGFAWWLQRQRILALKERLKATKERLKLARDQLTDVQSKLADAGERLAAQQGEITELQQTPSFERVGQLAQSNTALRNELSSVVTSTSALNETLDRSWKELPALDETLDHSWKELYRRS
jgi:hypothetical protein